MKTKKTDKKVEPGIYKHHKGKYFRALTTVKPNVYHDYEFGVENVEKPSDDQMINVVYQGLHEDCEVWTCPLAIWRLAVEGTQNFKPLSPGQINASIDKVGLILIKDKKILMARSKDSDVFYIPGGKREAKETDMQCLEREIRKELAVQLDTRTAQLFGNYYAQAYNKPEGTLIKMNCYMANVIGTIKANKEIGQISWLSYKDRNKVGCVAKLIFDDLYWKGLIV